MRSYLLASVRKALVQAGINNSSYAGHSFWIGAATTVLLAGVSDAKIKREDGKVLLTSHICTPLVMNWLPSPPFRPNRNKVVCLSAWWLCIALNSLVMSQSG